MAEKLSTDLTELLRQAGAEGPWIYVIDAKGDEVERLLADSRVEYLEVDVVPPDPPPITCYKTDPTTGERVYTVVSLKDGAALEARDEQPASARPEDGGQEPPAGAPVRARVLPLAALGCHAQSVRYVKFENDRDKTVHRWLSTNRWGLVTGKRWEHC